MKIREGRKRQKKHPQGGMIVSLPTSASPLKKSPKRTNLQIPPESLEFEKW